MHKLGISVYPDKSDLDEVYAYVKRASELGYTRIFTCFLSVDKQTRSEYFKVFKNFSQYCHELGFELAVDTNPEIFAEIGATPTNLQPLIDLGVDIIRLDGDFSLQDNILISRNQDNIKIEFNASMNAGLDNMIASGGNRDAIQVCHNFYPERYTGLDLQLYQDLNQKWKDLNLVTAAFVSSNNENTIGPWQVFCGLPSVEIHRGLPIDLQARHLIALGQIDDILIGNYPATDEELVALSKVNWQYLEFKVDLEEGASDLEKEILLDFFPHMDRPDYSSFMIRSSYPRIKYKGKEIPHRPVEKEYFEPGDIVIVNDNLAHYRGELQIVLDYIKNDGERNLVATIPSEEMALVEAFKPGIYFYFTKK